MLTATKGATRMPADLDELKQDAIDMVIFHSTPKKWLEEAGPWVLERSRSQT